MKKIKILVLLIGICMLTGCGSSTGKFESITYQEYKDLIANKESFVLEQWGSSCNHCSSLKPKLQEFIKDYGLTIKTMNLDNLTSEERREYKEIVGTLATPVIIFYKSGEEKSVATRIIGDVSYDKLVNKFRDNGIIE